VFVRSSDDRGKGEQLRLEGQAGAERRLLALLVILTPGMINDSVDQSVALLYGSGQTVPKRLSPGASHFLGLTTIQMVGQIVIL